jgi:hypothetical protein
MTKLRLFLLCLVQAAIGCIVGQAQEARSGKLIGMMPLSATQQPIDGYWEGFVERHGARLIIKVEFKTAPDGIKAVIDIPDLYIHGYKLINSLPLDQKTSPS